MAGSLGTISGQVRLDVAHAVAGFAALRNASAAQTGALATAGTRMTAFGKAALVAGGVLSAAFGLAISKAADFEKKMDYFGAVSNSTAEQMKGVSEAALELGRTSQFSASQIADAFVEMGKAGVSADQIMGGMARAMVNLAAAADIDLTKATNIVTSQIQAYSLTAQDAAHVTDVLAGAANASIVDVDDLGVSLKYVGGVAHAVGITFDSTVDALSLLGKAGIKGSTAGTSLRQIMVSLAGGTKKAKGVLEDLGIILEDGSNKFFDSTGKAKSLAEVFQILQDHTKGLTQEQQLMAFRTIFNNRALAAAEILTKNGAAGFAAMNAEISKTTAADVAAKRMDNLAGDIQKLKGNIDTLLIQAGTPFQEFLRKIVQGATNVVQAFAALSPETQTLIMRFIGITGAVLTFLGAFALITGILLKAAAGFQIIIGAFRLLITVTRILTIANLQMAAAALLNPYVLIALAVIALVAGLVMLYQKSEAFREIMDAIGNAIKVGFMATVEWFKGLPKFFGDLWTDIAGWFNSGVEWVKAAWDAIVGFFVTAPGKIWGAITALGTAILDFFKNIPGAVGGFLSDAWNGFVTFLTQLPYLVGFAIGWVIGIFVRFVVDSALLFWDLGVKIIAAVVWCFTELPVLIWNALTSAWNSITKFTAETWAAFLKWGADVVDSVVTFFSQLPGKIVNFFNEMHGRAVVFFTNFINASIEFAKRAIDGIIDFFKNLPGRAIQLFHDFHMGILNVGNKVVSWAKNLGSDILDAIISFFQQLPGKCMEILGKVIDAFKDIMRQAFNAAKDFGKGLWDGFKSGMGIHSPSYIERAMWRVTDVTGTESKRLSSQVRTMQTLAGEMDEANPGKLSAEMNMSRMISLTTGLKGQAALLQNATNSLFPMGNRYGLSPSFAGAGRDQSNSLAGLENGQSERPIIVNNFNPVAERGSDSAARKLRTLSDMGAF